MKRTIRLVLTAFLVMLGIVSCSYLNQKMHLKDDNLIEETVEDFIQDKFGLDLDLTP